MFGKMLIANRGEIACRIIRTAKHMGIGAVAVYSEVDRDAPHVRLADEAVAIGKAQASESYLNISRIVEACLASGAEAVHPGYGFLSERAEFARALENAGIAFIGPTSAAIELLGDKTAARRLAREQGLPIAGGRDAAVADADEAIHQARSIGYPVMLKAVAGGGGRGMRIASSDEECRERFARCSSEAKAAFGDERVFVEKLIEAARHVEIQVLGDAHGNVIHLGERDCSLQRRHQKLIEETPSPGLFAATRALMCGQAVKLAKAAGYRSAGTVEFLVDKHGKHFFLEMNTRLQVEHPVTEMTCGLDLVEWMIRIVAGERLGISQDDVEAAGWAIEARVNAEDPSRGFLPSAGRLTRYRPPAAAADLRIDDGVVEGGRVSVFYDSLLAKVIARGATRDEAIERLLTALDDFEIRGVAHNAGFLAACLDSPRFREGRLTTSFLAEEFPNGLASGALPAGKRELFIAVAAVVHAIECDHLGAGSPGGWQWSVMLDGRRHDYELARADGRFTVSRDERTTIVETDWKPGETAVRARIDDTPVVVHVRRRELGFGLSHRGASAHLLVLSRRAAELLSATAPRSASAASKLLRSPMPGLLKALLAQSGETVRAGQPLAIVEAMKMENVLVADREGTVARILAQIGETLAAEQEILEIA